ncbi:hypothetical protein [Maribacter sp. Asnod2-G09]|uniref:hypothetical protein n=1 Tax=Maribacter sp. Asnod2-G09 TaxID=3160577 RepID=UPI0038671D4D
MKNAKHLIALFYITLILLFKVAGLHALSHHSDETDVQHCEVCHITTAVNFTPLLETQPLVVAPTEFYNWEQTITIAVPVVALNERHLSSYLFTRPPPQFI